MSVGEAVVYLLGGLAVASSLLVVLNPNPVASLLFLVLAFFCLAGLFVTLEAHFLAAIQILVYAGAILVLFLFVIMLLNLGGGDPLFTLPGPIATALATTGAAAFVVVLVVAFQSPAVAPGASEVGPRGAAFDGGPLSTPIPAEPASASIEPAPESDAAVRRAAATGGREELDEVGVDAIGSPAAAASREDAGAPGAVSRRAAAQEAALGARGAPAVGTTERVGVALFRDFLLPFEVTSLLLLVAMVGAVMLAKRER